MEQIVKLLKANNYSSKELVLLVGDLNINSQENPFRLTLNSYLGEYQQQKKRSSLHYNLNEELEEEAFSEYETFQRMFTANHMVLVDHIFERYREHQVTYGDN
jgi:endonuclease/exonuclease/phosphatase family metal-dependent hydrolase